MHILGPSRCWPRVVLHVLHAVGRACNTQPCLLRPACSRRLRVGRNAAEGGALRGRPLAAPAPAGRRAAGPRMCVYVCMYVCMYVCIYIYIYIERERFMCYVYNQLLCTCTHTYIYIYIYIHPCMPICVHIHTHVYIYIYIYIYIHIYILYMHIYIYI